MELKSLADLPLILTFFVPGVLFQCGRHLSNPSAKLEVSQDTAGIILVISTVYAVVASIATGTNGQFVRSQTDLTSWLELLAYSIVVPLILGFFWGQEERKDTFQSWLGKYKLETVSSSRTAWEAMIGTVRQGTVMMVTLEGGHRIAGVVGDKARFSTTTVVDKPDVFLDETYLVAANGGLSKLPYRRGIWISGEKIICIEIANPQP